MYSSRMRTVCCSGHLLPHMPPPHTPPTMHTPCNICPPPFTMHIPFAMHAPLHHASPCGQTDTCENITFPQLLLRMVQKMATKGGLIAIMFLAPHPRPLDPLLLISVEVDDSAYPAC